MTTTMDLVDQCEELLGQVRRNVVAMTAEMVSLRKQLEVEQHADARGTIVPLYIYPTDTAWGRLIKAKLEHPTVRVVAIINPGNGPGNNRDTAYVAGIKLLAAAGIIVIGYVKTGYGARPESDVQVDIKRWRDLYPMVSGIFFDQMSSKAGSESTYRRHVSYAKSLGLMFTVGNPGTGVADSYIGIMDTMLVYESQGLPDEARLLKYDGKSPWQFGVIPYGVTSFDLAFVEMARRHVGYVYMTGDKLANPWDTLPPYIGDLLAALA